MSKEFKVGDKVWRCYTDGSPQVDGREGGWFYGLGEDGVIAPSEILRIGPYQEGGPDMLFFDRMDFSPPEISFHTRREALAEAIRQNEALASELTMEIARLKEEIASCKD